MGWLGDKINKFKDKLDDLDRSDPNIPTADEYRGEDGKYIIPGLSGDQSGYQKPDPGQIKIKDLREVESGLRSADSELLLGIPKAIQFIEAWADKPVVEGTGFVTKQQNQSIQNARQLKIVIHRLAHDPDNKGRAKCANVIKAWYATEGIRFQPPAG